MDEQHMVILTFEEKKRERFMADVRTVLNTAQGRRLLWHILCNCQVHHSTFHTDHAIMSHSEGKRYIGLELMAEIMEARPEAYDQMRREAASNAKTDEIELRKLMEGLEDE